jgi:hypothetical protein
MKVDKYIIENFKFCGTLWQTQSSQREINEI